MVYITLANTAMFGSKKSGYIAPKGWKPKNPDEDYIISFLDIELADGVGKEKFEDVVAACAAESSTGTWTDVYSG
jgi:ribulose 1,5-bisphosphate carboxylase large subunit-like protein